MDRLPSPKTKTPNGSAGCGRFPLRWPLVLVVVCTSFSGCSWVRCLVCDSPEKSHRFAEEARVAEENGQILKAVSLFERAVEETPNDPHLHRELARLHRNLNRPELALDHLKHAVEHNPDDVESHVELAEIYRNHDRPALAAEHLEAALQNDPKHISALLLRAKIAETMNDPETAIETYHRLLSCDPNHVEARVGIAVLQIQAHQPSLSAPLLRSVCQCSRATPEEIAEARWALGVAYGQESRWSDAVETLTAGIEQGALMSADDWYLLAYARGQIGDWDRAREDVNRALKIDPQHASALALLLAIRSQEKSPDAPILRIGHSVKPIPIPEIWQ